MHRVRRAAAPGALSFAALPLAALALLAGCDDGNGTGGGDVAASFVRLGEDLSTEAESWAGALPPDFDEALNPGDDRGDGDADRLALPVHPRGELVGSVRMRGADGERTYFLTYQVPEGDADVERTLLDQLDRSPWQVTGGQSNEQVSAVQFATTTSGDILGTAVIQPVQPSGQTVALRLRAVDGGERTVALPRRAPRPLLPFQLEEADGALRIAAVDAEGRRLGVAAGETLIAVADQEVASLDDLAAALAALRAAGSPTTSIVYIVQVAPEIARADLPFTLPAGRTLPPDFPAAFLVDADMTVLTHQWSEDPGIGTYALTLLSPAATAEVLAGLRAALEAEPGWAITSDTAVGFATQLDFEREGQEAAGSLSVDVFPSDEALTMVVLQLQIRR